MAKNGKRPVKISMEHYSVGKRGEERVSIPLRALIQVFKEAGYEMEAKENVIGFRKKKL